MFGYLKGIRLPYDTSTLRVLTYFSTDISVTQLFRDKIVRKETVTENVVFQSLALNNTTEHMTALSHLGAVCTQTLS